mgnify:CR=1 FL=1
MPVPRVIPFDGAVLMFTLAVSTAMAFICAVVRLTRRGRGSGRRAAAAWFDSRGVRHASRSWSSELALSVALVAVSRCFSEPAGGRTHVARVRSDHVFTLQFRLPRAVRELTEIARFFGGAIIARVHLRFLASNPRRSFERSRSVETTARCPSPPRSQPGTGRSRSRAITSSPGLFQDDEDRAGQGRDFTDRDDLQSPLVASSSRRWPDPSGPVKTPSGKRIKTSDLPDWITASSAS